MSSLLLAGSCALFSAGSAFCQVHDHPDFAAQGSAPPEGLSAEDWSGIRAAHDAARHAIHPTDDGFQARNPEQQWLARFSRGGFLIEPDTGDWSWGLKLESYGFADHERRVTSPAGAKAFSGRVTYRWDDILEEWYVNDTRGLEHGYTVLERPLGGDLDLAGPLTFTLAVCGGLEAKIVEAGRAVHFLDESGELLLTYAGLLVLDADGQELVSHFEELGDKLTLRIEEGGASYPLLIDPIVQQAILEGSNTAAGDAFGHSVAISGDTVVVGASAEDSPGTGVNGFEGDGADFAGAAYVFVRSGTTWTQEAYLKASNTDPGDRFGLPVAIAGDIVAVGAQYEQSAATGVDGDQINNDAADAGAVYVFVRNGTTWSQEAYLKASNTEAYDQFGCSVAMSGETLVVGAYGEDSGSTGVNGDSSDNSRFSSGATFVFVRSGTTWSQEAYLKASNTAIGYRFGWSVDISNDTLVVGSPFERSDATGVNGDQSDNGAWSAGAGYVFVRSGATWSQEAYLKASNTEADDFFGMDVAADGDLVVVGARNESSDSTGVNGDQVNNNANQSGAAYLFARSGTSWSQHAYLKASNTDPLDWFGSSVSVSESVTGSRVLVGAPWEDSRATGVNGDQSDNSMPDSGAVYLFELRGATWSQEAYLKASDTGASDDFGIAAALSDDTLVVGAYGDGGGAGSAYVSFISPAGTAFCSGDGSGTLCPCGNDNDGSLPGAGCDNGTFSSGAMLYSSGEASVAHDTLVLVGYHLEPGNSGLYFQADNDLSPGLIWGDGLRCAGGNLKRLQVRFADAAGNSHTSISISAKAGNITPGVTRFYQCWYRTTVAPPCGSGVNDFNTSNGYAVTWLP